jgi:hypothetical protein
MRGDFLVGTYRKVSEVIELLQNRATAEEQIKKVDKSDKVASKMGLSYIPWWGTVEILNEIFGVFGWDAVVTSSVSDTERGIYIVDGYLEVRAIDDDQGILVFKRLPGRGVGALSQSALTSADAHDMAAKGARSDFISVAAKGLGDALGIFLYDKADPANAKTPARTTSTNAATTTTQGAQESNQAAPDGTAPSKPDWYGGIDKQGKAKVGYATAGQAGVFRTNGWTNEQIAALVDYGEFTEVKESQFGDKEHIKPTDPRFNGRFGPGKIVQGGGRLQLVQPTGTDDEF